MTYKSILVPIDASPEGKSRTHVAARLAAQFDAVLTGIAVVAPLELPERLRAHPGAKAILKEEFEKSLAAADKLARAFPAAAGAVEAEARVVQGEASEAVAGAARSADLVVLSQPGPDDLGALGSHFVERMIVECSRPVLLVPRKGKADKVGRKLLVAWKGADASARALADARPFFPEAQSIGVLAVDEGSGSPAVDDAVAYVKRHGGKAKAVVARGDDAGEAILAQAKALGADLIVMGAFGRPRLAQMVLGGATRTVLRNMSTCVLMSH